jgi:hypothetical protein
MPLERVLRAIVRYSHQLPSHMLSHGLHSRMHAFFTLISLATFRAFSDGVGVLLELVPPHSLNFQVTDCHDSFQNCG